MDDAIKWMEETQQFVNQGRMRQQRLKTLVAKHGLSEHEVLILWKCHEAKEPVAQTDLIRMLHLSAGSISHFVDEMRKDGLLVGSLAANDRRRQRWTITDKGRERFAEAMQAVQKSLAA